MFTLKLLSKLENLNFPLISVICPLTYEYWRLLVYCFRTIWKFKRRKYNMKLRICSGGLKILKWNLQQKWRSVFRTKLRLFRLFHRVMFNSDYCFCDNRMNAKLNNRPFFKVKISGWISLCVNKALFIDTMLNRISGCFLK